ncbi:hypothetical protein [Tumebacillus permanentifrigoris]|uniref:Uncharacterized protein n=1 Tax=Tumebacillus permanentifrigoris TaxID=378543 RepID=A0A316D5X9_9BACL|nr:hypothetical protein [Tumebacillus permanentifrigoris]PWK07485.1 hypothetical protein C7459_11784 [Tumebacillus permanentifrigoris]
MTIEVMLMAFNKLDKYEQIPFGPMSPTDTKALIELVQTCGLQLGGSVYAYRSATIDLRTKRLAIVLFDDDDDDDDEE